MVVTPPTTPYNPVRFAFRFRGPLPSEEGTTGRLPESQGQNLALTVLHAPSSLDSGWGLGVDLLLSCRFWVSVSGSGVQGSIWGLGLRVWGLELGCRVQGSEIGVKG